MATSSAQFATITITTDIDMALVTLTALETLTALDRAIARVRGEGAHDAAGPAGSANAAAFDDALHAWSTGGPYWPGASMAGRAAELLCGPECWRLIEILEHT